jgi:serine/threonine-protein kinase
VEIARATLNSALPQVTCTWLDIGDVQAGPPVAVAMRGVAGNGGAAQTELGQALTRAGLANASVNFGDVAPITQAGCSALDTYRQIRNDGASRISSSQPRYEMTTLQTGQNAGQSGASVPVEINPGDAPDFALVGIEPTGAITMLIPNREALLNAMSQPGSEISDQGNGRYRINIDVTHSSWSGVMLVTGTNFDAALLAPMVGARGPDWQQQFLSAASNGGWRADMVWFETVNQQPD